MKKNIFLILTLVAISIQAQQVPQMVLPQQPGLLMGPPIISSEGRSGKIVCVASRQFGKSEQIEFSVSASEVLTITLKDIFSCSNTALEKLKKLEGGQNPIILNNKGT